MIRGNMLTLLKRCNGGSCWSGGAGSAQIPLLLLAAHIVLRGNL